MIDADLQGARILITRPEKKAQATADLIREWNGIPLVFPTIRITGPDSWDSTDQAIRSLDEFSWMIFSSGYGVKYFCNRLQSPERSVPKTIRIAAVGRKTARALTKRGFKVDLIPGEYNAGSLIQSFQTIPVENKRILHITGNKGRTTLQSGLESLGAGVTRIEVYRNVPPDHETARLLIVQLQRRSIDYLTFTSPSTFTNLWRILESEGENPAALLDGYPIIPIGPVTSETIENRGLDHITLPEESTIEGILKTIAKSESVTRNSSDQKTEEEKIS